MKHILNEMSEEEKNSIRSQHTGSISVNTERFKSLVENKLGNAKPLVSEQFDNEEDGEWEELVGDESELGSEENELEEDKIEDFDDEDLMDLGIA